MIEDTNGQEKMRCVYEIYYKKADGIILLYDITDKKSFESCKYYYCEKIKELCKPNIKTILIGNKKDLENRREISFKEGKDFSLSNGYLFMETSCLKNENVYEAFEKIIEVIFEEMQKNENNKKINNNENNKKINNNACFII